jgi:hypothetical protein
VSKPVLDEVLMEVAAFPDHRSIGAPARESLMREEHRSAERSNPVET